MIPYSRPKLSDLYTLFQTRLLENRTPSQWHIPIWLLYWSTPTPYPLGFALPFFIALLYIAKNVDIDYYKKGTFYFCLIYNRNVYRISVQVGLNYCFTIEKSMKVHNVFIVLVMT